MKKCGVVKILMFIFFAIATGFHLILEIMNFIYPYINVILAFNGDQIINICEVVLSGWGSFLCQTKFRAQLIA